MAILFVLLLFNGQILVMQFNCQEYQWKFGQNLYFYVLKCPVVKEVCDAMSFQDVQNDSFLQHLN